MNAMVMTSRSRVPRRKEFKLLVDENVLNLDATKIVTKTANTQYRATTSNALSQTPPKAHKGVPLTCTILF
jgi:hypothetical protein